MAVAITATEQDVYPPRVLVSVTGLTIGDSIELFRVVGGERTAVRAGSDDSVADTSFLRIDAELPFGVPVSYMAVVNGTDEYATTSDTYTLTGGKPVITDAISGLSAEAVIFAWDEKRYTRRTSVFRAGGRNVVVSDDWGQFEGTVEFTTDTTSQRDNLFETLRDSTEGVVQLRGPGTYNGKTYDGVDAFLSIVGAGDRRFSQDGSDQRRIISADVVEVDGWAPALEARGFTLQDIANVYDSTSVSVASYTFATTTESWIVFNSTIARVATPSQDGNGALRATPNGFSTAVGTSSPYIPISSGVTYEVSTVLQSALGWPSTIFRIGWFINTSGVGAGPESDTTFSLSAGVWTPVSVAGVAPATAAYMKITAIYTGSPATTSNFLYVDSAQVNSYGSLNDISNDYATLLDIAQADFS